VAGGRGVVAGHRGPYGCVAAFAMAFLVPPLLRDRQVLALLGVLGVGLVLVVSCAGPMAPFLAAVVIAYCLERMIRALGRLGLPRWASFTALYLGFFLVLLWGFLWLLPAVVSQLTALVGDLPRIVAAVQETAAARLEETRRLIGAGYMNEVTQRLSDQLREVGQAAVSGIMQGIPGLVTLLVYLVLVTLLVFFFLKDKEQILAWIGRYWPRDQGLLNRVLKDVDGQMGRYITGKLWEVVIVTVITEIAFALLGLHYAFLLALISGVSALIPYVGALAVTVPVALLAFAQWGFTWDAGWVLLAYGLIQLVDGNLLAPVVVGEAVHLHPAAIILALLVFGTLWGVWGAFFAVPLAVVVKSVLDALNLETRPAG